MAVEICAHITGTVWKIEVKVGDVVQAEQPVVILESMKMEMPVEASTAGTIGSVLVAEGETVDEGDVLVTIEPS
jgi:acetyl-CoA carboxylase biotin carboxyl carrier protein